MVRGNEFTRRAVSATDRLRFPNVVGDLRRQRAMVGVLERSLGPLFKL